MDSKDLFAEMIYQQFEAYKTASLRNLENFKESSRQNLNSPNPRIRECARACLRDLEQHVQDNIAEMRQEAEKIIEEYVSSHASS